MVGICPDLVPSSEDKSLRMVTHFQFCPTGIIIVYAKLSCIIEGERPALQIIYTCNKLIETSYYIHWPDSDIF